MDLTIKLKELDKAGDNEAIKNILSQELKRNARNLELLDFWMTYMEDYDIIQKYAKDYIGLIYEHQDEFPEAYQARLYALLGTLTEVYDSPQIAWETLVEGLVRFPNSSEIIEKIESIFSCPSDAPEPSDWMEILGKLVAQGEFPKDTFEYLLLICDDPEFPELFDLAKKNAFGQ
ncbi:hypothetical protein [Aureispira sp. CCB-E]|uniref:hypothetical protein n=1 Tax=Aureispira sp. CCB-E TaxID=3051121 RepID=UPI002868A428|nr:hypothetical protein [Aureispira sp. CCB-E]WMX13276.1 hypothetical protein QP953_20745 [Aureispira sp. CCB-E]